MRVKPLQDRIIVRRIEEASMSKGGIIIPESAKERPHQGKVIARGDGREVDGKKVRDLRVDVGDAILFSQYSGNEINIGDEELLILREDDVLGIVDADGDWEL